MLHGKTLGGYCSLVFLVFGSLIFIEPPRAQRVVECAARAGKQGSRVAQLLVFGLQDFKTSKGTLTTNFFFSSGSSPEDP